MAQAQPMVQAQPMMQGQPMVQPMMQGHPVAQPMMQGHPVAQPMMQAPPMVVQPRFQAEQEPIMAGWLVKEPVRRGVFGGSNRTRYIALFHDRIEWRPEEHSQPLGVLGVSRDTIVTLEAVDDLEIRTGDLALARCTPRRVHLLGSWACGPA
jgi:hypothetical protein